MIDKIILKLDGISERQERALIYSGYRISLGRRGKSYIKDIDDSSRFHAYPMDGMGIEMHLDRTNSRGWHYVAGREYKGMLQREGRRIMKNYRELRKQFFAERHRLGLRDEALDHATIIRLMRELKSNINEQKQ